MIDNLPTVPAITSTADPFNDWKVREQLNEKAIALNKANILEAFKLVGISEVVIEFNGSGDDGGVESVTCDGDKQIPDTTVNEWSVGEKHTLISNEAKLNIALGNFAYSLLEHTHAGWENDAGAFGDITIDVSAGTAKHTHNDRFEDYSTSTYNY
jgi:hypothetical protein